ncbi:aspartyl-phosphate phosphatase Spo0E family protein [Paenibacillus alvei]|uniref:aspartyl-phosphate phosphatase Spo0E family protein n=1 Tax=Paenibacillus alvei TaxID=44250 RepID=UPI001C11A227|nr:aspartyl-phosphate phosphatase Spo0E family protein [Paenibacillus alvei]MCY7483227.1 aspartyl-phosphate phosphatase Spo0E family protein [Paenibacillus alvei]
MEDKIVELRKKLIKIVENNKGGFSNEEVVIISQELDRLILEMQKRKRSRN